MSPHSYPSTKQTIQLKISAYDGTDAPFCTPNNRITTSTRLSPRSLGSMGATNCLPLVATLSTTTMTCVRPLIANSIGAQTKVKDLDSASSYLLECLSTCPRSSRIGHSRVQNSRFQLLKFLSARIFIVTLIFRPTTFNCRCPRRP